MHGVILNWVTTLRTTHTKPLLDLAHVIDAPPRVRVKRTTARRRDGIEHRKYGVSNINDGPRQTVQPD